MSLAGKRIFITGGSRGIGLAIALRAAADGASIAIAAKTAEESPKLPGTIFTAASEIDAAGGKARGCRGRRRRCRHSAAPDRSLLLPWLSANRPAARDSWRRGSAADRLCIRHR